MEFFKNMEETINGTNKSSQRDRKETLKPVGYIIHMENTWWSRSRQCFSELFYNGRHKSKEICKEVTSKSLLFPGATSQTRHPPFFDNRFHRYNYVFFSMFFFFSIPFVTSTSIDSAITHNEQIFYGLLSKTSRLRRSHLDFTRGNHYRSVSAPDIIRHFYQEYQTIIRNKNMDSYF